MRIVIETIPHSKHRYETVGDFWWEQDGSLQIRVSKMVDERYSLLVALHEMIEATLCERRGIAEPDIMAFDQSIIMEPNEYADDPGHDPAAPYHVEHVFAECIERLMAQQLGVNWQEYGRAVEQL